MVHAIEPVVGLALRHSSSEKFDLDTVVPILEGMAEANDQGVKEASTSAMARAVLATTYHRRDETAVALSSFLGTFDRLNATGYNPRMHTKAEVNNVVGTIDANGDRRGAIRLTKVCFDVGMVGVLNRVCLPPSIWVPARKQHRREAKLY